MMKEWSYLINCKYNHDDLQTEMRKLISNNCARELHSDSLSLASIIIISFAAVPTNEF